MSNFPIRRLRRLRKTEKIRDLVQEISLSPKDLICPIFVEDGIQTKKQIQSMPAMERLCLLYTSPSPRDGLLSRMPSSA